MMAEDPPQPQLWNVVRQILTQIDALEASTLQQPARELQQLLAMHERLGPCEGALDASLAMHTRERDVYADKMQRIARRLAAEGAAAVGDQSHEMLSRIVLTARDQLENARQAAIEAAEEATAGSTPVDQHRRHDVDG
mmetsp:Transcript_19594/g.50617  ORF Transcript_19594/g.50617 Transcript_19594/m.50617 type:complete len:138 (-) Transcript_19594:16-429(-)